MRSLTHPFLTFAADAGTGTADPPPATPPANTPPPENLVGEANRKAKAAEATAAAAEARAEAAEKALREKEDAEKSEVEKLTAKVATLEGKVAEKDTTITKLTREGLVRDAFNGQDAPRPVELDAAMKFLDLDAIETPEAAKAAVTTLSTEKPYLFTTDKPPVTPFGSPGAGGTPPGTVTPVKRLDGTVDEKATLGSGLLGALETFRNRGGSEAGAE